MASVNVDKLSLKELLDLEGKIEKSKTSRHSPRSAAFR